MTSRFNLMTRGLPRSPGPTPIVVLVLAFPADILSAGFTGPWYVSRLRRLRLHSGYAHTPAMPTHRLMKWWNRRTGSVTISLTAPVFIFIILHTRIIGVYNCCYLLTKEAIQSNNRFNQRNHCNRLKQPVRLFQSVETNQPIQTNKPSND